MQVFVTINKDGMKINVRCECRKELSDKERCDKGLVWNPSNCNCECDKSCDIGEYLDYENCKCRRKIVGELVEECSKNFDAKMIYSKTLDRIPCTLYIVMSRDNKSAS